MEDVFIVQPGERTQADTDLTVGVCNNPDIGKGLEEWDP